MTPGKGLWVEKGELQRGWSGGGDEGICPKGRMPDLPGELQGWAGWTETPLRAAPFGTPLP